MKPLENSGPLLVAVISSPAANAFPTHVGVAVEELPVVVADAECEGEYDVSRTAAPSGILAIILIPL